MTDAASFGLSRLTPRPADPLLGLMADYRADPRSEKIDLGVGVYRDETGATPLMDAVARAEARLAAQNTSKVYEGPRGNLAYCAHIEDLIIGQSLSTMADRVISFATPGGCGALSIAMGLIARTADTPTLWISAPTWPNHPKVAAAVGLATQSYRYYTPATGRVSAPAMMQDLANAKPGDAVLIQGPCHNPTGADLPLKAWEALGDLCAERQLIPLIDIAYHGLASSLDEDMQGVRALIARAPQALVCYSCSKNFGLYRERAGALVIIANAASNTAAIASHASDLARTSYSMPPAHGPALVAAILDDPDLTQSWHDELATMRERITTLRTGLVAALSTAMGTDQFAAIGDQNGMFSQLQLPDGATDRLRAEQGIYLPSSGRINVAGLHPDQLTRFAEAVAGVAEPANVAAE